MVFAVLPQIRCNLQQLFCFSLPLPEFLILSLCCQLQVIKGKEKKRKKFVAPFFPVSWALLDTVGSCGKGEIWDFSLLPKSHSLTFRSHHICSVHLRTVNFWGQRCSFIWFCAAPNAALMSSSTSWVKFNNYSENVKFILWLVWEGRLCFKSVLGWNESHCSLDSVLANPHDLTLTFS